MINYNEVSGAFKQGCNSLIVCLKLLKLLQTKGIYIAGADGYKENTKNYYDASMKSTLVQGNNYNLAVIDAIRVLNIKVNFITPSEYDK